MKPTLIIGATSKTNRYAYIAAVRLQQAGHPIFLIGRDSQTVLGEEVHRETIAWENIDTVTLYINPSKQPEYYDYIISLQPKRVIFNPGTENEAFRQILISKNIVPVVACTLVMLSTGQY
ncbi:CoA-binding protein [Dyadobacter tibetensis]|uniref:CoA-binding protein n=1 Tax=Dyadobacter tibetensis TaxID=1211851 RepID=UPI0004700032|nr:CoA-binding protein [Dyadobacter tibetensis]